MFVIGPEVPLVQGLADQLRSKGKLVFGPGADGARLEGSKAWMKDLLVEAGINTARHKTFFDQKSASSFLDELSDLYVIKTDGLAAGKGVLVTNDRSEADDAVESYLSGDAFGDAGKKIIIEEGLSGPEISILAVCDGTTAVSLAPAQDFKRLLDKDMGPNTGGMGAYSPVPLVDESLVDEIMETAVLPTLRILQKKGINYRGILYCGLMLTPEGPKVLEYNVRFGDPEAQVVLPRLATDLAELLFSAASGSIHSVPKFTEKVAVTVVCASELYPASPRLGDLINGLEEAETIAGINIFYAGVKASNRGLVTNGGRVLTVTGMESDLKTARNLTYEAVRHISWPGMYCRSDIASDLVLEKN